jgi:phage shock protein PspC (stress-responsive transcriptional regulator)
MDLSMNVNDSPGAEPPRSGSPSGSGSSSGATAASSNSLSALPPKRLYRDPSGPIGGVAGGFAGYFDVDPAVTRLLWIIALFSGVGFPAYLVCWLVIPKAKVWPPPGYGGTPASVSPSNQTALLSGLVILGLVAIVGTGVNGLGQYLLPAALVGVGVYLLSQRGVFSEARAATPVAAGSADPAAGGASSELAAWQHASATASGRSDTAFSGRTGLVTPTVLSLLAIGAGVLAALHAAGLLHVSVGSVAAGALVIVGGGLLASLWFGRARGLVPVGMGLVCVMLVAPTVASWADDAEDIQQALDDHRWGLGDLVRASAKEGTGNVSHAPQTFEELQPSYELGAGELTLDLTALDFSGTTRDVRVEVGVGKAVVILREDAPVEVHGEVGIGDAEVLGNERKGLGANFDTDAMPPGTPGKLALTLEVGIGHAEVRRGL